MNVRLLVVAAVCLAGTASAVRHRRPFHPGLGLGYGYDNNFGAAGCSDYACGGKCYNGHTGSDFPLGLGNDVLAGAGGTVIAVVQGCADYGYYGNPCGGQCGNHVRVKHADGTNTLYCHLKNGSIVVGNGQGVGCGQKLGQSASSGSSTGYHLHFGWNPGGTRDPFSGGCSGSPGGWVDQGGYNGTPSSNCEVNCACSPGAQEYQGCGNCGYRVRGCGGDCQWGGWSGCQGEGPCSPGQSQSEACCDCGSRWRGCEGNCQWGGWSGCAGPDPAGPPACNTGKLGDCALGHVRCVNGCLGCVDSVFPTPELCDGHDSDCDGPVDEDATEMGVPPPGLAAELVDLSAPAAMRPGEVATVWAVFANRGTEAWESTSAWLAASGPDGAPSPLRDPTAWSAYDVPVAVTGTVAPGESTTMAFPILMPGGLGPVATEFVLSVGGLRVPCPAPGFMVAPMRLAAEPVPLDVPDVPDVETPEPPAAAEISPGDEPGDTTETEPADSTGSAPDVASADEEIATSAAEPTEMPTAEPAPETSGDTAGPTASGDTTDSGGAQGSSGCTSASGSGPLGLTAWVLLLIVVVGRTRRAAGSATR